ncbi:MAG TPA: DUF2652 domain-containing protein [Anaerolineales bacterium]|nr:DUF2652 domain-containing protein [Anaerolineales bacterium]
MANKGFFILTDISGYTEFLTKSELDHAQDALQNLFDVQLAHIKHPFVISGFRGDAIFMYVPETNFCEPQTLLESLENLYFVFADALRQMIHNTNCPCRACRNMSALDLKMVIHHGEYVIQKLGDREELLGADVIVPHRMLKNRVTELTGIESYAIFSDAAAQASNLSSLAYPLVAHSEVYEHLGEVRMQVLDLRKVWERDQDKKRFVVAAEDAWLTFEWDVPGTPSLVWEYLTTPRLEQQWAGYDFVERTDSLGGRFQSETTYHCAHGDVHFFNKILDWKPFEYVSLEQNISIGIKLVQTRRLYESPTGTKLIFHVRKPDDPVTEELKNIVLGAYNQAAAGLKKQLETDFSGQPTD